jgi:small nuclear ribonucleoprotein (snRNP)-like protein
MQRPLDVLGSSTDKKIIIRTKSGENIIGTLKAFDSHINIWLDEARIEGDKEVKIGKVLIRGDSIVYISPEK